MLEEQYVLNELHPLMLYRLQTHLHAKDISGTKDYNSHHATNW